MDQYLKERFGMEDKNNSYKVRQISISFHDPSMDENLGLQEDKDDEAIEDPIASPHGESIEEGSTEAPMEDQDNVDDKHSDENIQASTSLPFEEHDDDKER